MLIVTIDNIPGREIVAVAGFVKGTSVRARNFGSDIGASFKSLVGGEINAYSKLQEESRQVAITRIIEDTKTLYPEANAIVGFRIVSSQIAQGASEITVYGTAVTVK